MPIDTSSIPISASVLLGAGLYALVGYTALGGMVSDREIANSDWGANCEADLRADIQAQREPPAPSVIPQLDCQSTFGLLLGRDAQSFCREFGNFEIPIPGASAIREQEQRLRDAEERRVERAASQTGSRCECASAVYQSENAIPLAVYAGSARTIVPAEIRNRASELMQALQSPQCANR